MGMDPVRAENLSRDLRGRYVGGWLVGKYRGAGKSAVVFEAEKDGKRSALKVFDPELVERFGRDVQLRRIQRECGLIGEEHPNVIRVLDGGECTDTRHLFVSMELIAAPNLGDSLTLVPRDSIGPIIRQIAAAARFLEGKNLAHRDIKPENIVVLPDFSRAILLDLGVLRPFGDPNLTDEDQKTFVGTLRYSSPEFLTRTEEDTPEGWRAISFYQLGAVLHDLIMRRPLFNDFSDPFALLVEAVKTQKPVLHAGDVSADLILLAQNCLVKSPAARLSLVSWDDFDREFPTRGSMDGARERVKRRVLLARAEPTDDVPHVAPSSTHVAKRILEHIDNAIRFECTSDEAFPPMTIIHTLDAPPRITVAFAASRGHGLSRPLCIFFECHVVDESTMSFELRASACTQVDDCRTTMPASFTLFRGPLDSIALISRIREVLWQALDKAQGLTPAANSEPQWLTLEALER